MFPMSKVETIIHTGLGRYDSGEVSVRHTVYLKVESQFLLKTPGFDMLKMSVPMPVNETLPKL